MISACRTLTSSLTERHRHERKAEMLTRRQFGQLSEMTGARQSYARPKPQRHPISLWEIAPYQLEASPKHKIRRLLITVRFRVRCCA